MLHLKRELVHSRDNMAKKYIVRDQAGMPRCWWCGHIPIYVKYHDTEWGRPVNKDRRMFEKICLEGFQSGLSWITILKKRESFRAAFDKFEIKKVAKFSKAKVERLVKDESIIRHRGKIEATINNANRALEMIEAEGSLAAFFWKFEPAKARKFDPKRATTKESEQMSRELKKRGWKFVGPTTCYSFMQSMGIVNDHHPDCHCWKEVELLRKKFTRPTSTS